MIRFIISILSLIWITSCYNEDIPDCLKSTGNIQDYTIDVSEFVAVDIHDNINVIIEQGVSQSVKLTTGSNLVNKITFDIIDNELFTSKKIEKELVIKDLNRCNWVRDYGNLIVHIITPRLSQIRSSGGGVISSKRTLRFNDQLTLISELFTGDFILDVDMKSLRIVNNDLSNYHISGNITHLNVGFFAGDGRFEGANLIAENATAFQRGTNDMIINATKSITGTLRSTGNIIYCTEPDVLDIEIIDDRGSLIHSCE